MSEHERQLMDERDIALRKAKINYDKYTKACGLLWDEQVLNKKLKAIIRKGGRCEGVCLGDQWWE